MVFDMEPSLTVNGFLRFIVQDLIGMKKHGLVVTTIDNHRVKLYAELLMIVGDSPARR